MDDVRTSNVQDLGGLASWCGTRLRHGAGAFFELGLAGAALACYLAVRALTHDRVDAAVSNAQALLALERRIGVDWEHSIQDATVSVPGLSAFFAQFYIWGYFPAAIVVTVWLYVRHRAAYRRLRNALVASGAVGLLVYALFPCAPPWTADAGFTDAGFTDAVANGPFTSVARPSGITNHLGAVPSFHVGWVILIGVVVLSVARSRIVRVLCVLHPAAMGYAVISTGNHWVLDVPAGALLAVLGLMGGRHLPQTPSPAQHGQVHSSATGSSDTGFLMRANVPSGG